jgi:hypothetical protein
MLATAIQLMDKMDAPGYSPVYRDRFANIEYEQNQHGITIPGSMGQQKTPVQVMIPWHAIRFIVTAAKPEKSK